MSAFKAGDRIKLVKIYNTAVPKEAVVKFVGNYYYLVNAVARGYEQPLPITFVDSHYKRVPTFPEWWFNVYEDKRENMLYGYPSREGADAAAEADAVAGEHRIGVLHISADGSVEMLDP